MSPFQFVFFPVFWEGDPDLWLEAYWEPPTIAKISPRKMALGIRNVKQNGSNPLVLFSKWAQTKSGWDPSALINGVSGDRAGAGE